MNHGGGRSVPLPARQGWVKAAAIGGCTAGALLGFAAIMASSWMNVPMALIFGAGGIAQWIRYQQLKRR